MVLVLGNSRMFLHRDFTVSPFRWGLNKPPGVPSEYLEWSLTGGKKYAMENPPNYNQLHKSWTLKNCCKGVDVFDRQCGLVTGSRLREHLDRFLGGHPVDVFCFFWCSVGILLENAGENLWSWVMGESCIRHQLLRDIAEWHVPFCNHIWFQLRWRCVLWWLGAWKKKRWGPCSSRCGVTGVVALLVDVSKRSEAGLSTNWRGLRTVNQSFFVLNMGTQNDANIFKGEAFL